MKFMRRSKDLNTVLVLENSGIVSKKYIDIKKEYGIVHLIRFHDTDFKKLMLYKESDFLTHFNIQRSAHKKNALCLLVRIAKKGHYDGKNEIKPILGLNNSLVAKCVFVKNNVSYESLKKEDFKNSLPGIKTVSQLKKAISRRYRNSLSNISDVQKMKLGVGITQLVILKKIETVAVQDL